MLAKFLVSMYMHMHEGSCRLAWRLTCRAQVRSREDSSGGSSAKTAPMSSAARAKVWKVPCASAPADSVPSASLPPAQTIKVYTTVPSTSLIKRFAV